VNSVAFSRFAIDGQQGRKEEIVMKNLVLALAASVAMLNNASVAFADTVTTTTIETTRTVPEVVLTAGTTYVAVNPTSGVLGTYDYTTKLIHGAPLPLGCYVIEQTSGKVIASVDSDGSLVAFRTVPTVLPEHFVVRNGVLFYLGSDYSARRALLEAQISSDYAAGRLSNDNVKELREKLQEIQTLEMKRRVDGTFRSSTAREIERKFARVQSDYAEDIAEINSKKAKIGIVND
jgi:hypothetical protein